MPKEYGCGQLMADGDKCTSASDMPCLCDVCQLKLIRELESQLTPRAADKPSAPHAWSPCSQCGSMGYCTHRDPAYR